MASCYEHELDARTAAEKAKAESEAASVDPSKEEDEGHQAASVSLTAVNDRESKQFGGQNG